jgi:hypothetical protein
MQIHCEHLDNCPPIAKLKSERLAECNQLVVIVQFSQFTAYADEISGYFVQAARLRLRALYW